MKRALVLALLVTAPRALAVDVSLNFGALEVVLLPPAHGGFYPYVGAALAFPVAKNVTVLTSLSLEASFELARGGLVFVGTLDWLVAEHVGLDLNVGFIHDQPGFNFAASEFFLGAGPGVSFLLGRWTLSPFLSVFGGLRSPGWSLVPGVNVAWTP
jgi:hypothetical protein